MNGFRRFMMGRYGGDKFGMFLIILSIAISIVLMFVPVAYISLLAWIPLIFAIYRMFSKNVAKRQQENYTYLRFLGEVKALPRTVKKQMQDSKTHRYFRCPKCGQKLRVPKGKGKINITCSKCGNKFIKKT